MTTYVTRVELHGVYHDAQIYNSLHGYMAQEGFVRYLVDGNQKKHSLPTATYALLNSALSIDKADAKAANAAAKTAHRYWTLTTVGDSWHGHYLPVI